MDEYPGDRAGTYIQWSGGLLSGAPTHTGTTFTTFSRDEAVDPTPPDLITMSAGDSIMLESLQDFRYGDDYPDGLTTGYWLVRKTGAGALELADAYDLGFNYPSVTPTWTDRAALANTDDLYYIAMDPVLLDASHQYNDGAPLVRLTCTSGTVDVTFVGVQIEGDAGMWLPDGGTGWSANQPSSSRLVYPGIFGDDTYVVNFGSKLTEDTWAIDDSPRYMFLPRNITEDEGRIENAGLMGGSGHSEISVEDARAQSLILTNEFPSGSPLNASGLLQHTPAGGIIFEPEHWDALISEHPRIWSAPLISDLPNTPVGMPATGWRSTGTFEWLDTDTHMEGWQVGDGASGSIGINGDAQTVDLLVNFFSGEFPDPNVIDFTDGTVVETYTKPDDGDPVTFVVGTHTYPTTTENIAVLSFDCSLRTGIDFHHIDEDDVETTTYLVESAAFAFSPYYRVPPWRYGVPTFVRVPFPGKSWVRNIQRRDGLATSTFGWRGYTWAINSISIDYQWHGIRWRGIR